MRYELRKTLGNFSPWERGLAADGLVANSSLLLQGRSPPPRVLDPSNNGKGVWSPAPGERDGTVGLGMDGAGEGFVAAKLLHHLLRCTFLDVGAAASRSLPSSPGMTFSAPALPRSVQMFQEVKK